MIHLIHDKRDNSYCVWSTTNDNSEGILFYLPSSTLADPYPWFTNPPLLDDNYQVRPDDSPNNTAFLTKDTFVLLASFESIADYQAYRESCYELLV